MSILSRARPEIIELQGYSSARKLSTQADDKIFLDANECPFEPIVGTQGFSRYPSQQPKELVQALCQLYDISSKNLIIARGADEVIDLLIRAFCIPYKDNIIINPPTFAMYQHSAVIQGVETKKVSLNQNYSIDANQVKDSADPNTKIIFTCSPNNPTANLLDREAIFNLCEEFFDRALVVVDETYLEFSNSKSLSTKIENYPNLVIIRTLSKSYASAGLRCGSGIAHSEIISLLQKVLPPYPIPVSVVQSVCKILLPKNLERINRKRQELLNLKKVFIPKFKKLDIVKNIFPSHANFILVQVDRIDHFIEICQKANIVVRNQSHQFGLENCVRISIGTPSEMERLINALEGKSEIQNEGQRCVITNRNTAETQISASINLDKTSPIVIDTGHPFFDHMLEQIARHGGFSLQLECMGDLQVEPHHTLEDCVITLGEGIRSALGDKTGISRYGSIDLVLPMDETKAKIALDVGGRFYLSFKGDFPDQYVGNKSNPIPIDMIEHLFRSFAENLRCTLHIDVTGRNTHHMVEACFKGLGRALRQAIAIQNNELPSTKGLL